MRPPRLGSATTPLPVLRQGTDWELQADCWIVAVHFHVDVEHVSTSTFVPIAAAPSVRTQVEMANSGPRLISCKIGGNEGETLNQMQSMN
jgi:hypothetical protein